MIDVREIKLSMRYPESRQEDITDAFMRGYTGAVEIGNKAIKKLEEENAELRELLSESRQANERMYIEIKRYKNVLRTRPISMNALFDENTKLRKLAKAAWGCVNRHVSCDECRMSCGGCTLQSAMRELGIEVQP